jgi:hypothetical protein
MRPVKHHVVARAILKVPVRLNRVIGEPHNLFDSELYEVLLVILAVAHTAVAAVMERLELALPRKVRIVAPLFKSDYVTSFWHFFCVHCFSFVVEVDSFIIPSQVGRGFYS